MSGATPPDPSPLDSAAVMIEDALQGVEIVVCWRCGGTGKIVFDLHCPECPGHHGLTTARHDD